MIGYYNISLIGSAHLAEKDGVCQDSNGVKTLQNGWVAAAVADGLGSAKHSDIGSRLAVTGVLHFIESNCPENWHDESLISLLRMAYHYALKIIKARAAEDGNPVKDYDTTLTSVIYNGRTAVFGHIGDGGIIALSPFGNFSVLTCAQKGEEFNSVMPLRSSPDKWLFRAAEESAAALLLLTDGVYDIACPWLIAKQEQKIYVNYVRPLMDRNILPVNTAADFENAQNEIIEFFSGDSSRYITDDKTILGIINTDMLPEVKPDDYYTQPDWDAMAAAHRKKLYGDNQGDGVANPVNTDATALTQNKLTADTCNGSLNQSDNISENMPEASAQQHNKLLAYLRNFHSRQILKKKNKDEKPV